VPTESLREYREMPRYLLPEVSRYARVNVRTLESWVRGHGGSPPLIKRPSPRDPRLSYDNLVEAYALAVLRRFYGVSMQQVRRGLRYMKEREGIDRFLLSDQLRMRLGNLLFQSGRELVNVGRGGQAEIPEAVAAYLNRIRYSSGMPILYPLTRPNDPTGPQRIVMLPHVGFGRPVTEHKHITAATIASRFAAGESVDELARDYELEPADIEEALRVPTDDEKLAA
jgi:uncharacterized protein (DUF433 family)